jgi:hypothetical protein
MTNLNYIIEGMWEDGSGEVETPIGETRIGICNLNLYQPLTDGGL